MRYADGWKSWRLVVKLDPDKKLPAEAFAVLREKTVSAVVVGGTQGVNYRNTSDLIESVRHSGYGGPLIQEVSAEEAVVPGVDAHFIPVVLNSPDSRWLVDSHISALKKYGSFIDWSTTLTEGYLVCNPNSAVGRLTRAKRVSVEDAVAYTALAEKIFGLPLLYIEYSGLFGDMELLGAVSRAKSNIHLVYGGGVRTAVQLNQAASLADTVVIGNIVHEDPGRAGEIVRSLVQVS